MTHGTWKMLCQVLVRLSMLNTETTAFLDKKLKKCFCTCRLYALKKIELDESRKTRTKEAVLREARYIHFNL